MRRQVLLPQLLAVVTFRKLGPASGIQFNSLSYHLINSDDVHHHAVSLDRDSARQLRCWGGVSQQVLAVARAKTRVGGFR